MAWTKHYFKKGVNIMAFIKALDNCITALKKQGDDNIKNKAEELKKLKNEYISQKKALRNRINSKVGKILNEIKNTETYKREKEEYDNLEKELNELMAQEQE